MTYPAPPVCPRLRTFRDCGRECSEIVDHGLTDSYKVGDAVVRRLSGARPAEPRAPTPYARGRIDTSFPHTTIRYRDVNSGVQVVRVM